MPNNTIFSKLQRITEAIFLLFEINHKLHRKKNSPSKVNTFPSVESKILSNGIIHGNVTLAHFSR